ncbi:MAG TPA: DUF4342 domain-containing protein [Tissierellia bacterium]|nr:DUF4342 domain-containing protein [Tissierellia bacterium]
MEITLEKVDEIIRRKKVSYQAAKQALEDNNGDILEALASLDQTTVKKNGFWSSVRQMIEKLSKIKLSFEKEGSRLIGLPITIVLVLAFFFFPVVIGLSILLLLLGYNLQIDKSGNEMVKIPALDLRDDVH